MKQCLETQRSSLHGRYYREALGIKVGDLVTTDYGTGPYEVWSISDPRQVTSYPHVLIIRAWPIVDLALIKQEAGHAERRFYGINGVRKNDEGWSTDQLDEVLVQPNKSPITLPIHPSYSYPPLPEPYVFQPGVDYFAGHRQIWHCTRCGRDWNASAHPRWEAASCQACQGRGIPIAFMHDRTSCQSEYVLVLNA